MRKTFFSIIALIIIPVFTYASEPENVSFTGEIRDGISRLGSEAVSLAKTPFQVENDNIFITLGIAGAVGLTYIFDRDIQSNVSGISSLNKAADAGTLAGDPFIHLGFAALVYGGGIAANSLKWKKTGEMIGEALILADASTLIIKEATGRGRPNVSSSKSHFYPFAIKRDFDSFPSMHTSSSFALASVLAATSEKLSMKILYYSAATFVGFSRIYKNKHWASDIVLGAALGELCGRVVTSHHASATKISLVPQAFEGGVGLAMVQKW